MRNSSSSLKHFRPSSWSERWFQVVKPIAIDTDEWSDRFEGRHDWHSVPRSNIAFVCVLLCMIKWIQLPAHSSRIKRIINAVFSLCYTLLIGCACYDWTLHDSVRALHLSLFIAKLCEMAFINCTRTFEFSTLIIINCRDESMHRFYIVVLLTEFSQLISDFIKFLSRNKDATKKVIECVDRHQEIERKSCGWPHTTISERLLKYSTGNCLSASNAIEFKAIRIGRFDWSAHTLTRIASRLWIGIRYNDVIRPNVFRIEEWFVLPVKDIFNSTLVHTTHQLRDNGQHLVSCR